MLSKKYLLITAGIFTTLGVVSMIILSHMTDGPISIQKFIWYGFGTLGYGVAMTIGVQWTLLIVFGRIKLEQSIRKKKVAPRIRKMARGKYGFFYFIGILTLGLIVFAICVAISDTIVSQFKAYIPERIYGIVVALGAGILVYFIQKAVKWG